MVLVFLAEGFEETEAVTPIDILRRGGAEVKTCSLTPDSREVTGAHGLKLTADLLPGELPETEDCILLPGGMPGTLHLRESDLVRRRILAGRERGIWLTAICAAPTVLSACGVLQGERATCYPGMEGELDCAAYTPERVVVSGRVITGCGPGAAAEFGLTVLAALQGADAADRVRRSMCYPSEVRS
ncbi:MAG: DJ-1/PfpI family protein [Clostridia bacterium]|nr:DJ-1/PfpI family protein [Clostridia bacterium]